MSLCLSRSLCLSSVYAVKQAMLLVCFMAVVSVLLGKSSDDMEAALVFIAICVGSETHNVIMEYIEKSYPHARKSSFFIQVGLALLCVVVGQQLSQHTRIAFRLMQMFLLWLLCENVGHSILSICYILRSWFFNGEDERNAQDDVTPSQTNA